MIERYDTTGRKITSYNIHGIYFIKQMRYIEGFIFRSQGKIFRCIHSQSYIISQEGEVVQFFANTFCSNNFILQRLNYNT